MFTQKISIYMALIILMSLLIFIFACDKQNSKVESRIEEIDGVTIIRNPNNAIYMDEIFSLEEDLSIGIAEGNEDNMFSEVYDIAVDTQGNIYVTEGSLAHIRVFDETGSYLRAIGRKGQGPGEFQMPVFVQITSHNEVLVHDYMAQRLSFFSLDGEYLKQIRTDKTRSSFIPLSLCPNGNLVVEANSLPLPIGGKELIMYDSDLDLFKIITKEERGTRRIFDIGKPSWYCDVSPSGSIVWGNSKEYVLYIFNQEGDLEKKIEKEYTPLKITSEDKERFKSLYSEALNIGMKLNFYRYFPAFSDISIDDEERIFVKTYESVEGSAQFFYFDIFDSEGRYLAKVPINVNFNKNSVWKANKLYVVEEDDEGYPILNRYKVEWKK